MITVDNRSQFTLRDTAWIMTQLSSRGDRRVPYYKQRKDYECGLACVQMILASFRRRVAIGDLRKAAGDLVNGSTARELLALARRFGLHAGFRIQMEPTDLRSLAPPLILHWDFRHFVVLERFDRVRGMRIVDPMCGPAWISDAEASRRFTGVALFFSTSSPSRAEHGAGLPRRASVASEPISPFRAHMHDSQAKCRSHAKE